MSLLAQKKEDPYERLKKRKDILVSILRKDIQPRSDNVTNRDRVRYQIQNPQHDGHFVGVCCDHCYSDLYREVPGEKEVICPGCGWETTFP